MIYFMVYYFMPFINKTKIRNISTLVKDIPIETLNVYDTSFYPSIDEPVDKVIAYFLIMVAMDHRLSRPGKPYEAIINGNLYRGAELLYYLGARKFEEDPDYFTPERLVFIKPSDIVKWLSIGKSMPPDPELRAHLLNDIGIKTIKIFNGDFTKLIELSEGFLRRKNGYGLQDLLKNFKAYQDPVEKKSYLLIKFLNYRKLFKPLNEDDLNVAVDNHLTRVAIRLGLIELEDDLIEKVRKGIEATYDEDIVIRLCVREAYKALSRFSNINAFVLDDMFWTFGRNICTYDSPKCDKCFFKNTCKAYKEGDYLTEHIYIDTWYY